jgi:malate synthase
VPLLVTAKGLQDNIEVALEYLVNWLSGNGAVGINNLMEDAATAEISRCQLWQWRRNLVQLDTGRPVTRQLITVLLDEATETLADTWAERTGGKELLADSRNLLFDLTTRNQFVNFLTLPAYDLLP